MRARRPDLARLSAPRATGSVHGRASAPGTRPVVDRVLRVQRTAGNGAVARLLRDGEPGGYPGDDLAALVASRRGGGERLPPATRTEMEAGLGAAFGDVRVHHDTTAQRLADRLDAHAFTVGTDVFFGRGAFAPQTDTGRTTLAHELVHTLQGDGSASGREVGPGLRVSDPGDPQEVEAAAIADAVVTGGRADTLQGVAATGPGPAIRRDARDEGADGARLPHRALMEQAFGEDFSGLRVTIGAARALDDVDASAATDGTSVAFASRDPAPEDVAHELAHVVQRRRNGGGGSRERSGVGDAAETEAELVAARVVRGGPAGAVRERTDAALHRRQTSAMLHPAASPEVRARYDAWVDGVYAAARHVVTANVQAVEAWRSYVLDQLAPREMAGQVYGTAFLELEQQAVANHAMDLLPQYAAEPNPIRQQLLENQMAGRWRNCTACHVSNQAWAEDSRMRERGIQGVTPAELLGGFAGTGGGGTRSVDAVTFRDPAAWDDLFQRLPSDRALRSPPAPPAAQTAAAAPLPAAHAPTPATPSLERSRESSMAAVRQALLAIQPHLEPLGDGGYKIIPSNVISRFGLAPLDELRTALDQAFARRLGGYHHLLGRIAAQRVEYLEFDTLVGMLKPMAPPEVRALVDDDAARAEREELFEFLGLLVLDLVSIVVPPLAVVAGALHVARGLDQVVTGMDRHAATGLHGLMSPERQASGQMMVMGGALEVLGGAVQVAGAVSGMRAAGGGARVVATQRQGPITLELLENGTVRATHTGYPGKSLVMRPDGVVHAFDEMGNVVGTGVVGRGGGQAAASQAWGGAPGPGPGPGQGSTSIVPHTHAPVGGVPVAASPWPPVSPFFTGGAGPGTLAPTPFNPSGRADNCGFCSIAYAGSLQNPGQPLRDADQLFLQRLEQLGFTPDVAISRQLVFPEPGGFAGMRSRPGYEPLFNDSGNQLEDWTLPATAQALGVPGDLANSTLRDWNVAFGRHADLDAAVQARVEQLEASRNQSIDPAPVRRYIQGLRAQLPGTYIVGSRSSAHYLTITIDPQGGITGLDPQNRVSYGSLDAVLGRMGRAGFDMFYKVTLPLPPGGAP